MNALIDKDDIHLRLLRMVEADPHITQREMKQRLGISLGMVNFSWQVWRPSAVWLSVF
jgi:hypothetical protein